MSMTNRWLAGLSLALSTTGYVQDNAHAVRIGILCFVCVLLAQLLTPKHPSTTVSRWTLYASRLWGWACIVFMAVVVLDQAITSTSILVPTVNIAWELRRLDFLADMRRLYP